jgi:hypothetical protein
MTTDDKHKQPTALTGSARAIKDTIQFLSFTSRWRKLGETLTS